MCHTDPRTFTNVRSYTRLTPSAIDVAIGNATDRIVAYVVLAVVLPFAVIADSYSDWRNSPVA